ncbi:MAG: LytR C-terminal domain-containing protein [Candidatus Marinimicrobia bacterium]|nr:LytR C-terminal domain-containing protein [Candidatus Neomarinimicrobiota bacterium]
MTKRTRQKRNNHNLDIKNILTNLGIGCLLLLSIGFFVSLVDNLFFDDGRAHDRPDLATLITKTKYEEKTGHKITVEIHNGCGIPKLAILYTEFLRSEGFDVIDSRNADNFEYTKTQILHHQGDKARAISLGKTMTVDETLITAEKSPYLIHDLTLILGSDYQQLNSYQNAVFYESPF